MKYLLFLICICMINITVEAQFYERYSNEINRILIENNLKKDNMIAQDFNVAGMFFYNRRSWYEAEIMFYTAIDLDNSHILASYNLACVLSIRLNNSSPRFPYLSEEFFDESAPFAQLYHTVRLDPNRGIRARNDPDFDNIRNIDSRLFNAVTLPEDQRERFLYEVIYIDLEYAPGIGLFDLIFADIEHINDENRWHRINAWQSPLLKDMNLYYSDENEWFPRWIRNEEMIGKRFRLVIIDQPGYAEGLGGTHIILTNKVFSITEIN